ncbi:MAG TPA: Zn-ribbon domain-containing OB-fold protein [Acidimicrobiia bacterium]|nr:Zn-ribbon domain-containing OB-fold protein [Acidimicrobiia bacterium]
MSTAELSPWDEMPKHLGPWPSPEDREFWAGARRGELRIQRCASCGLHQHYARLLCSHCGSLEVEWITASGAGTVHSFTVVRQNGVPPFAQCVPFVVALVELAEPGARILAAMPTVAPDAVAIGMPVRATFRSAHDPELGFVDFAAADVGSRG